MQFKTKLFYTQEKKSCLFADRRIIFRLPFSCTYFRIARLHFVIFHREFSCIVFCIYNILLVVYACCTLSVDVPVPASLRLRMSMCCATRYHGDGRGNCCRSSSRHLYSRKWHFILFFIRQWVVATASAVRGPNGTKCMGIEKCNCRLGSSWCRFNEWTLFVACDLVFCGRHRRLFLRSGSFRIRSYNGVGDEWSSPQQTKLLHVLAYFIRCVLTVNKMVLWREKLETALKASVGVNIVFLECLFGEYCLYWHFCV